MAGFYETLAQYYDELFPAEQGTVDFLDARFRAGGEGSARRPQILDLACGTGAYTSAFTRCGYDCYGIDGDPAMIARAQSGRPGRYQVRRMEEIAGLVPEGGEPFDGAFCIGNSLPHLDDRAAVRSVLSALRGIMRSKAALVIQTVNFSRFTGSGHGAELPPIERPTVTMERRYRPMPGAPGHIRFEVRLQPRRGPEVESAVTLLVLTPETLGEELRGAGFRVAEVAGGFDGAEYDPEGSFIAVVSAVAE
jgi:SAM-dependent methyltransferase